MNVELRPDLERRLEQEARRRSLSVPELVETVLNTYLETLADDPATWVRSMRPLLPRVWPAEDFSDWQPPDGR